MASSKSKRKFWFISLATFLLLVLAFLHFVVGWHHIPTHFNSISTNLKYAIEEKLHGTMDGEPINRPPIDDYPSTTVVDSAVVYAREEPFDTAFWSEQIRTGQFIPEGVKESYEIAKKTDFSHLEETSSKPTDLEAQQAIVHRYKQEVVKLLRDNDAHIRIGKAYTAELQPSSDGDTEIARVTAMVCAFSSKGVNLGNIQLPLTIVYDFVKYESDPNTWYITDFSQTIPFDYALQKR